jgi:hypothetical protein
MVQAVPRCRPTWSRWLSERKYVLETRLSCQKRGRSLCTLVVHCARQKGRREGTVVVTAISTIGGDEQTIGMVASHLQVVDESCALRPLAEPATARPPPIKNGVCKFCFKELAFLISRLASD